MDTPRLASPDEARRIKTSLGTSDPDVQMASNGFLLLTGGNHCVLKSMSRDFAPPPPSVATFRDNARTRLQICTDRGIALSTWIFPDKLTLFAADPVFRDHGIGSLYRRHYLPAMPAGITPHYLGDVITDQIDFQRTDTHLSVAGRRKAVLAIARELDFPGQDEFVETATTGYDETPDFCGDLGRRLDPVVTETTLMPRRLVPYRLEQNKLLGGNNGRIALLTSPQSRSDRKLLIFGDSFFNQILPYLAYFFRQIVFLRTRYFHSEMLAAVAPDLIFCGMAERYLTQVARDSDRPHFMAYPALAAAGAPTPGFSELWKTLVNADLYGDPFDPAAIFSQSGPHQTDS